MDNFHIHFEEPEREAFLSILMESNDIIINNIEEDNIGIAIELDDAEPVYYALLERIEREVRSPKEP